MPNIEFQTSAPKNLTVMEPVEGRRLTLVLNVTPSTRTRSCNTSTSEKLGSDLLDAAEEYQSQIPDGLYLKLCNLAKVQHTCVSETALADANAVIHALMKDLHEQYGRVHILQDVNSRQTSILEKQIEVAKKREEVIETLQKSLALAKETVGGSLDSSKLYELDDKSQARLITKKRPRK